MSTAGSSNVVHLPPQHRVFINFRGKELRGTFVSHLKSTLKSENINVYIDNNEGLGQDLNIFFKRIKESRIAISIISSMYTQSNWCLNELVKIQECVEKGTLVVFPIFYKVSVDIVKKRSGQFGLNFDKLVRENPRKREVWIKALKFLTGKKCEVFDEHSDEVVVIYKIVKAVKKKLEALSTDQGTNSSRNDEPDSSSSSSSSSSRPDPLFGIQTRLEHLKEKFDFDSNEVTRFVGVVGMPGIGKTTLARKLFDDCGYKFLNPIFLDDVGKKSLEPHGFQTMQMELLSGLKKRQSKAKELKDTEIPLESLKAEFSESKVFIVLDNVSEKSQIEKIIGRREWLRKGSRIVITTSSMSAVKGVVDETYLVPALSDSDALKYFEKHAFSGACDPSFMNHARKVVDYSRGHPLTLKLLGGELLGKNEAQWKSKIDTLAKSPISNTIQKVLRIPYDGLSEQHKDLFLDLAFFFRSEDEYHMRSLLNCSELKALADKFLINICGGQLEINDLMYTLAMGLESQSSSESGHRFCNHGDIIRILEKDEVDTSKVRGIILDMYEVKKMSLESDTFKEMNNLRYLKFFNSSYPKECEANSNLNFPSGLKFTLQEIRYLHWVKFPLKNLPEDFEPRNLIDLKLPYSQLEQVWEGEKDTSKLMWLDLNHSRKLRTLAGLSRAQKLQSINLEGCRSLKSLPQINLISLQKLILNGCSNLKEFNLISENLEELYLNGTAITELPSTIGKLQRLVLLTLKDCKILLSLPDSIRNLKALQKLVLSGCSRLASFPEVKDNLKHLKTLLLDGTAITEMPHILSRSRVNRSQTSSSSRKFSGSQRLSLRENNFRSLPNKISSIFKLSGLQSLSLSGNNFRSLPNNMSGLYNLKWFDLKYCEHLISLPMLPPSLNCLDAHGCISLENIENSMALITTGTEHSQSKFIFTNCVKLDQVAKNGILSYVRKKIRFMSDALTHHDKGSIVDMLIGVCYPSWQLPVWFNHRTFGSELTENLPRYWNENGLTGIALCVVVSFKDYQAQNNRLFVRCTSEFKEKDESLIQFSCILGSWTEPRDIIKSVGHVFIGYLSLSDIKKRQDRGSGCVATEASFKFEVTDGINQITDCEVVKCGFTLIYAPTKSAVSSEDTDKSRIGKSLTKGSDKLCKLVEILKRIICFVISIILFLLFCLSCALFFM